MILKKLFVLVLSFGTLAATAQTPKTYSAQWKKIDSLINKAGLTESALAEVNKIYAEASREKNDPQVIKSLLYRMNLQMAKEEDPVQKNIISLEREIAIAPEPSKSILKSIAAGYYWNYFQMNRWRFYNRTETVNFNKDDIATWSAEDFHKKIGQLFLESIRQEKLLQGISLERFKEIIERGNVRHLRPTLFDLLAHRALEYFRNDERDVNKPAYSFQLNERDAFANAPVFVNDSFQTRDTASFHYQALRLYQRLLRFHLGDQKPDALIDADIHRVQFVYQYSVRTDKDSLYLRALQDLISKHNNNPMVAQAYYLVAEYHASKARQYHPLTDTLHRFDYITAKRICDEVIQKFPGQRIEGVVNSRNLLLQILEKELTVQSEKVNVPGQPFRLLINYRNFTNLHFRLINLDKSIKDRLGNETWSDDFWVKIAQLNAEKTFAQALPDTKDHQRHAVEVKHDELPVGEYALLASVSETFGTKNNFLAVQFLHVSNISYINNGQEYFVLDRTRGIPLSNARVQVWNVGYDYQARRNIDIKGELVTTDRNGFFKLPINIPTRDRPHRQRKLEFSFQNDRLYLDDFGNYYYGGTEPVKKADTITYLFTDRSIYRPGQILYIKGIAIEKRNDQQGTRILSNTRTSLFLFDANGQKIDSVTIATNEFGSYSARFSLPSSVLNGEFQLVDKLSGSSVSISIEEYKRPKFLVELKKPSGAYKVNDTVTVIGSVKAYAGQNMNNGKVRYRVTRRTMMPFWRNEFAPKIWPPYPRETMEIAFGETTVNEKGEFLVKFAAIPDLSLNKKDQPVFYYEVSTDVTDISGETRSGSTTIAVSYQAFRITIDMPAKLPADSLTRIKLSTTNLNDVPVPAQVSLSVSRLKSPNRVFRKRYWQRPDQFVMTEEQYRLMFPIDIYNNEDDVTTWAVGEKVFEKTINTDQQTVIPLGIKTAPGWYVVEALSKDAHGEQVRDVRYVLLTGHKVGGVGFASIEGTRSKSEPGESVSYKISSNLGNIFLIHDIARNDTARKFLNINNSSELFAIPVLENDRGGIGLNFGFVKDNRVYTDHLVVEVPFSNKELKISFETFREKVLPGNSEKWKVKISGTKADKVAAEVLTAMYDASLDQFRPHSWTLPSVWNRAVSAGMWNGQTNFVATQSQEKYYREAEWLDFDKRYDQLMFLPVTGQRMVTAHFKLPAVVGAAQRNQSRKEEASDAATTDTTSAFSDSKEGKPSIQSIQPRKNFNETAFFFPDLKTDDSGNVEFSFPMPEALTQWKWLLIAHSADLSLGLAEKMVVTQKDLMVETNPPRFLREGDRIDFIGKISNLTNKEITGQVELQLFDPSTNQPVDGWFQNMFPNQYFTVAAGQSSPISFSIAIPFKYNRPVTYRLVASSGSLKDGEEMLLPIVSNQVLVTESITLPVRTGSNKQFRFEKLLASGGSETLTHHKVTAEFTSNPAWYAIHSLPYMIEYAYECSEQLFGRLYANALATKIANNSPAIMKVFEQWKKADSTNAEGQLLSNLQKNQELKSVLLQETPWVLEAKNEEQQKKNLALLFDMIKMSSELNATLGKLEEFQSPNGGFVWFKGGRDDRYMTQYIITGIGHLQKLNAIPSKNLAQVNRMLKAGIQYLDKALKKDYDDLLKTKANLSLSQLGPLQIQYLYMRSFFSQLSVPGDVFAGYNYFRKQSQQFWLKQNRYSQGMIAIALHRTGDIQTAKNIVASLKQNALNHDELGMYWKDVSGGYYWYQAPVETQSLLIEAFSEITKDKESVNNMKTWLLKQKQTSHWRTTKATADACYALLLQGDDWLSNTPEVRITLGTKSFQNSTADAGTGYFKQAIDGRNVNPSMGDVQVVVSSTTSPAPAWGAVYWQYFEDLDKITPSATPLKLTKKLFIEKNTDRGPVLQPVNEGQILNVGDKIKVRIELTTDRNMEYIHMKDMRASCMEPANVISQFKWQGGLGYYKTTKDASTSFFFNFLPRGTYVFEYPMFVTHTGSFSNGITTIQSMYAPEFTSHSEGVKVNVEAGN